MEGQGERKHNGKARESTSMQRARLPLAAYHDALICEEQLEEEMLVLKDAHLRVPRVAAQRLGARHEEVVRRVHGDAASGEARPRHVEPTCAPEAVRLARHALKVDRIVVHFGRSRRGFVLLVGTCHKVNRTIGTTRVRPTISISSPDRVQLG